MNTYTLTAGSTTYQVVLLGLSVGHADGWNCQLRLGVLTDVENYHALHTATIQAVKNGFDGLVIGGYVSFKHFSLALPTPDDRAGLDENTVLHAVITLRYFSAPTETEEINYADNR